NTIVGIGAFDCHMGAVGGQIEPYHLSKVMGTSTCDMLVAPTAEVQDKLVNGICGQVTGSIIPGMVGMEAGQSAFGDAYAWFRDLLSWPLKNLDSLCAGADISLLKENVLKAIDQILPQITLQAQSLAPDEDLPLAMDWLNGRRTPDANQLLKGGFMDVNLATDAPRFYRALVEATCFGAKAIVDRFQEQGIPIRGVIALGGVARKSPFIMQMMADVLQMPIRVHRSEQTCALGAAMFAATAAGLFPDVTTAMAKMGQGFDKTYYPDKNKSVWYKDRYQRYQNFGNFIERQTAEETITAQKDESIATA
ncbi:MAG TPA: FGGY-family carbohydrate kinase, partial [Flavisolibacter sp.]|nr:FGGY-family carbohydrate kinase [Flavisolibacter sp.]